MYCTHCKREFDEKLNTPRLLILCGHTLCQSCCYRLHSNNKVECPECHANTFIESIGLLPKNLALIKISGRQQMQESLCMKHQKKYEAFCDKEKALICIQCILADGHKSHQMDSIKNAYEKHIEKWTKKIEKLDKFIDKVNQNGDQNQKCQQQSMENYINAKQAINSIFKELKQILERQQNAILSKFRDLQSLSSTKFEQQASHYNQTIISLHDNYSQLQPYSDMDDLSFLSTFNHRESIFDSISFQIDQPLKPVQYAHNRKCIIESVVKVIQSINNNQKAMPIKGNQKVQQGQTKKDQINSVKAVRKAPSSANNHLPNSNNQNNPSSSKPMSKKPINKKEVNVSLPQNPLIPRSNAQNYRQSRPQPPLDLSCIEAKESLCHSFMSNMTAFVTERRYIYVLGGFNEDSNNLIKLNLANFGWEDVGSLGSNRSKFGAIVHEQQICMFGGKRGKERVSDIEFYNYSTGKWSRLPPMQKPRSGFGTIVMGEYIYFIGGNDGDNILSTVQTLNLRTGQWKRLPSMNESRDELAVALGKGNKIYAIGGFGGKDNLPLKSVEVYDPKLQKWKFVAPMSHQRRALSSAVLADGIYAIGGFDGSSYMSSVERYDESDNEWAQVASMLQPRCTHTSVSIFQSQEIYVLGGFDYIPLDTVQRYSVISGEWQAVGSMPNGRFMHSAVVVKEDML